MSSIPKNALDSQVLRKRKLANCLILLYYNIYLLELIVIEYYRIITIKIRYNIVTYTKNIRVWGVRVM